MNVSPLEAALDVCSAKERCTQLRASTRASRDAKLKAEADLVYEKKRYREVWGRSHADLENGEALREALSNFFEATEGFSWARRGGWIGRDGTREKPEVPPLCFDSLRHWEGLVVVDNRVTGLVLRHNLLRGVLPAMSFALVKLDLGHNELKGPLPPEVLDSSLETLNLAHNLLDGEIPDLSSSLRDLDLSNNRFHGKIPELPRKLRRCHLAGQMLTSLPTSLKSKHLRVLNLAENTISGDLPPLEGLQVLEELDLSDNALTGGLPPIWPSTLKIVAISNNHLTGPIPATLFHKNLRELYLDGNGLSGAIPGDAIVEATQLTAVNLSRNRLTGPVPATFAEPPHLRRLDLSRNPLDGDPHPQSFENCKFLDYAGADGPYSKTLGRRRRFVPEDFAKLMNFQRSVFHEESGVTTRNDLYC